MSLREQENKCYERVYDPVNGIHFVWKDRVNVLFAPYSFLSHVRLNGGDELVFEYSFGTVTVEGCSLYEIYDLIDAYNLKKVTEQPTPKSDQSPCVKRIHFEPIHDAKIAEPIFPGERYTG